MTEKKGGDNYDQAEIDTDLVEIASHKNATALPEVKIEHELDWV